MAKLTIKNLSRLSSTDDPKHTRDDLDNASIIAHQDKQTFENKKKRLASSNQESSLSPFKRARKPNKPKKPKYGASSTTNIKQRQAHQQGFDALLAAGRVEQATYHSLAATASEDVLTARKAKASAMPLMTKDNMLDFKAELVEQSAAIDGLEQAMMAKIAEMRRGLGDVAAARERAEATKEEVREARGCGQ